MAPGAGQEVDEASGLVARLAAVIRLYPSREEAAAVAGVSVDQLRRYLAGRSAASFRSIACLAAGQGISLDWVATGWGPRHLERVNGQSKSSHAIAERVAITPELVRAVVFYWLSANQVLEKPRSAEELSRLIAEQCEIMRGEERAARFFAEQLWRNIEEMRSTRHDDGKRNGRA